MCLSIGTLKTINFPFVANVKFIIFRCPKIWAHYSLIIMCQIIGTPKNHYFPFGTNGKLMVLGVPIIGTLEYIILRIQRLESKQFKSRRAGSDNELSHLNTVELRWLKH